MSGIVVMLSVDTEEDNWRPARADVSVENIRELPRFQLHCERLGVRPTYFTTYQVASAPWAAGILRDLSGGGRAEVAAHLHPWNTPPLDEPFVPRNSMTKNLPLALQHAKIATLTRAIEEGIGMRPTSFRAGRYGLGRETTQVLIGQGYRVDSSVTPWISWVSYDEGPDFIGAPLSTYTLDGTTDPREPVPGGPLLEVPLSSGFSRWPFERWGRVHGALTGKWVRPLRVAGLAARVGLVRKVMLSPEISSPRDMLRLARHLVSHGVTHLHLTLHSPTLRPGLSPFSQSRRDVERLHERIDRFVDGLARTVPITFSTVGEAAGHSGRSAEARASPPSLDAASVRVQRPKRLVVISYHCPPDGEVGGLRWAGFSKYLVRQGWEVHLLTASTAAAAGLRDGVQIHVCPRWVTLSDVYNSLARRARRVLRRTGDTEERSRSGGGTAAAASPSVRRRLVSLLGFPDYSRGWTLRATSRARGLLRRMEPDVVVTSGPPHTAHVVGAWASTALGVPMVADLRDPWFTHKHASNVERALSGFLQRRVFGVAREVIANTQELAADLRAQYPALKVTWARNGVDVEELPPVDDEREPGLTIVHAGTLYWRRSLGPVLRAFRMFLDRYPQIGPTEARLRVAGQMEPGHGSDLRTQVRSAGLEAFVEYLGVVSRAEALRLAARSSVSVVLAQDQKRQVPAKLYELVAMRVPTVVITEEGSAAAAEARRLGAYVVAPDDVVALADLFVELWQGHGPETSSALEPVDYATLAQRMAQLLMPDGA